MVSQLQTQGSILANPGTLGCRTLLSTEQVQGALWKAVEGRAIVPVPSCSKLNRSLSFARTEVFRSGTGPCNTASMLTPSQRAVPKGCNASLSGLF